MINHKRVSFVLFCILFSTNASTETSSANARASTIAATDDPFSDDAVSKYLATLPRVTLPWAKDIVLYVVDGDLVLREDQVRASLVDKFAILNRNSKDSTDTTSTPELLLAATGIWAKGARALSYAVDRESFPDEEAYQTVVQNFEAAETEWEAACTQCDIRLQHVSDLDLAPTHDKVTFIVRYFDTGGQFIAAAFFPGEPPSRRFVLVDPSYFTTSVDQVGVFRHELGHVLGYRHEHTHHQIPGCFFEDNNWYPLTEYDPESVMHYPCGGGGSYELEISDNDRKGHRRAYGE